MTYTWNIPTNNYFNIPFYKIYNELTKKKYHKLRLVYAIRCYETGESYYGSSGYLRDRMDKHLRERNTCASKKIISRGNYVVEVVEYDFDTDEDMVNAERFYINNFPCVNERVPCANQLQRLEAKRKRDREAKQKKRDKEKWCKFILKLNQLILNKYKLNMLLHSNAVIQ